MKRILTALLTTLFILASNAALADDFSPAPWRGQPLTVAAEWEFINQDLTDLPPDYFNNIGDGIHSWMECLVHMHPTSIFWEPDPDQPGDGRIYTVDMPGTADFFLCNWIDDYEYKFIWVQITYGGQGIPTIYEVVAPNQASDDWPDPVFGQPVEVGGLPGSRIEFWLLPYNPNREYVNIEIPPFTWVDQIWIETISTFEIDNEDMSWSKVKNLFR